MSVKETIEGFDQAAISHTQVFGEKMAGVKRVDDLVKYGKEHPREVARVYLGYARIIDDLLNLSDEEREMIAKANEKLGKSDRVAKFFDIVKGREKDITDLVTQEVDTSSQVYQASIAQLTEMMTNADSIKKQDPDAKPKDGESRWDTVIWGYTNGAEDPLTDIHFVIAHGLTRIISQGFQEELEGLTMAEQKDWVLNAITDVVVLRGLKGIGREATYYKQWREKRPKGLGWISDEREAAYMAVLR